MSTSPGETAPYRVAGGGPALPLRFPRENRALHRTNGGKNITGNAQVMTLPIAESHPDGKDALMRKTVSPFSRCNP